MTTPHIPQKEIVDSEDMLQALPQVLTVDEVAKLLRVNRKTLYDAISRKEIPCTKVGRVYRFSKQAVLEWLNGQGCLSLDARRNK